MTTLMRDDNELTVVVLAGAVARGPYEAGVLAELLPRVSPNLSNTVFVGTSAGAINAALWARFADGRSVSEAGRAVEDVWRSIHYCDVLRPLVYTLLARNPILASIGFVTGSGLPSILDTAPLRRTIRRELQREQIANNLAARSVRGLAVVATACGDKVASARSHVFMHALPDEFRAVRPPPDSSIDWFRTELTARHVLASSAVPALFPPVRLSAGGHEQFYVDGGVRLNTPIAPAVWLGAKRVIVVSSHTAHYADNEDSRLRFGINDSISRLLHTVLADGMIEDLRKLKRVNALVERHGSLTVRDDRPGYRKIEFIVVSPKPGELAARAHETLRQGCLDFNKARYRAIRSCARVAGVGEGRDELLSYFLFDPTFAQLQFDLGRADAAQVTQWSV